MTYKPVARPQKTGPAPDFDLLAAKYKHALCNILPLVHRLGVSAKSLRRLDVGWDGRNYTFPMRDAKDRVIGIRVRGDKGKWAVTGSRNGLFWPQGVYAGSEYPVVFCEGESDCAALLDLGFDVVGRPSCSGGVSHIIKFLDTGRRRDVVIFADKDAPKTLPDGTTFRPGEDGARRLAAAIKEVARSVKVVKPPRHKDIRDWYQAGATKAAVEAVVNNMRYVI